MTFTYGALFAGYGGLELGVQSVLGGRVLWHSEIEPGPCRVLAHHWPDTPNLGDITKVDWATVPPVDVITGGSPCQDVSHAGARAGMRAGTRSGLWASMCDAVEAIRPRLVVWENVGGVLSAGADSNVEPCAFCVGDGSGVALRALGRVVGDLSELGYDAWWATVRASDAGAAHQRARVFVFAWPTDSDGIGRERGGGAWGRRIGFADNGDAPPDTSGDGRHEGRAEPAWIVGRPDASLSGDTPPADWGPYAPAIERWASILGRPAPPPTDLGSKGAPRLSARFVEFLMGLPDGHVTSVPGLSRNAQLKALGNGVVPQQAALATRLWLDAMTADLV